ncbi:MAG TPA: peptidoglycan-binding protein [Streptosporangiaceae bacterium]|nr:peptidoglycan-binding protein [Streptosporangiaceae bacterium]
MANLRVSGWGPFPIPGEKARLRRLEKIVGQLIAASSDAEVDDPVTPQSPPTLTSSQSTPTRAHGNGDEVELSGRSWEQLGERKLFFEGQEGADVAQLQQRLTSVGFLPEASISGRFDKETRDALAAFQHKFGIFVDGVAGSVTIKVLRFLESINYQPDNVPVSDDVLVLIQRITRSQKLGIVLIGKSFTTQRSRSGQMDARQEIFNRVSRELVNLLNEHPILQGERFPEGYTPERTVQLANSIDAELVLYLDVLDSPDVEPGIATFFFSTGTSDSAIGAPLAGCIHDELVRVPGVIDRGCKGEDSPLLQGPNAPTVRIELGNLRHHADRARLEDRAHIKRLADATVTGISRLYDLNLPGPTIMTPQ